MTDPESAISATSGCGAVTIAADQQATTYTCSATSGGGSASDSVSVKRDATSPVVTYGGNAGGASTSFTVSVTPASLCNLVRRWVDQNGLVNSLCQQLFNGAYDAFRNRVQAQSGKAIPADKAEILINLSNSL